MQRNAELLKEGIQNKTYSRISFIQLEYKYGAGRSAEISYNRSFNEIEESSEQRGFRDNGIPSINTRKKPVDRRETQVSGDLGAFQNGSGFSSIVSRSVEPNGMDSGSFRARNSTFKISSIPGSRNNKYLLGGRLSPVRRESRLINGGVHAFPLSSPYIQ